MPSVSPSVFAALPPAPTPTPTPQWGCYETCPGGPVVCTDPPFSAPATQDVPAATHWALLATVLLVAVVGATRAR